MILDWLWGFEWFFVVLCVFCVDIFIDIEISFVDYNWFLVEFGYGDMRWVILV